MAFGRLAVAVYLAAVAAALTAPAAFGQVSDPPAILDTYDRARSRGDVDGALAQFADDAVVTVAGTSSQSFVGKTEIRRFLQLQLQGPSSQRATANPVPTLTSNRQVVGDTVTWTERVQRQPNTVVDLDVHAVVRQGKIKMLIYAVAAPQPAPPPATQPPLPVAVALAPVLLIGALHVGWRLSHRQPVPPRAHGQLLAELRAWQSTRS